MIKGIGNHPIMATLISQLIWEDMRTNENCLTITYNETLKLLLKSNVRHYNDFLNEIE